jgi:MoaA/NifB/PqqE/SkfB family radical SAM enzyme
MLKKTFKKLFFANKNLSSVDGISRGDNFLLYRKSRGENSADCPNLPLNLLVEVTSKCNLSCRMCNIHHDAKSGIMMNKELLEKTFELAETANVVSPFGLGEPLLHPDIVRIVGRFKSVGTFVGLVTNGMLLNERISRGFIENRLDQLVVSVDAADPDLFAKIRRGADLQKISDNITTLNHLKQTLRAGNPSLALNVVVQSANFSQLPQIIHLAEKWDIHFITFVPVTAHEHIPEIQNETVSHRVDRWQETLELCRREAGSAGISIETWQLSHVLRGASSDELYKETVPCPEPFRFIGIRANGDLFPCCNWDLNDPLATFSGIESITLSDFEKAWRNQKWQELREMVISNRYPDQCRKCMKNFTRPLLDEIVG